MYSREYIRQLLRNASLELALRDKSGESIVFRSHDFRRLFATEAVNNGLPIHIAAKLLGHTDLNTTRGYVGVRLRRPQLIGMASPAPVNIQLAGNYASAPAQCSLTIT